MARGIKTGGRDFQVGESGNPNGRPAVPEDIREASKLTRDEFVTLGSKFFKMNKTELSAIARNPKSTVLEVLIASIIEKAISAGDPKRFCFLLDRIIGKIGPEAAEPGTTFADLIFASMRPVDPI